MRILVTGSLGFIGRHLFERLKLENKVAKLVGVSRRAQRYPWDIALPGGPKSWDERLMSELAETVNCDLTQEGSVASLMLRYRPDVVFHLAADPLVKNWGPGVSQSAMMTTHHLLTYAPQGCRFVLASSATVYGDPTPGKSSREIDPLWPTSAYGAAKAGAEHMVMAFHKAKKVNGLSVRLAATVGGGASHGLIPDIVRKLLSDSPTLDLIGDAPGSVKPFTHVSDVVDGLIHFGIYRTEWNGPLNLALPSELSVANAAHCVMEALLVKKPVSWSGRSGQWKGDNPAVRVDSELAYLHGWSPKFNSCWKAVTQAARELDPRVSSKPPLEAA